MALESRIIKNTLDSLFGRDISIKNSQPLEAGEKVVIASYVNGEGDTVGAVMMDFPCACYMAAALSMMPADIAEENIKNGAIEDALRDNLYEVFNVGVSFFSDGITPDMRIHEMHIGKTDLPDEINAVLDNYYTDLHLELDIPGYGSGMSSLYLS